MVHVIDSMFISNICIYDTGRSWVGVVSLAKEFTMRGFLEASITLGGGELSLLQHAISTHT